MTIVHSGLVFHEYLWMKKSMGLFVDCDDCRKLENRMVTIPFFFSVLDFLDSGREVRENVVVRVLFLCKFFIDLFFENVIEVKNWSVRCNFIIIFNVQRTEKRFSTRLYTFL